MEKVIMVILTVSIPTRNISKANILATLGSFSICRTRCKTEGSPFSRFVFFKLSKAMSMYFMQILLTYCDNKMTILLYFFLYLLSNRV